MDQVGMAGVKEGEGLPFLLQYVIFPYEHGEHLKSELWVEPQHGTIASCPTGLQYLLGLSHTHIANAVSLSCCSYVICSHTSSQDVSSGRVFSH